MVQDFVNINLSSIFFQDNFTTNSTDAKFLAACMSVIEPKFIEQYVDSLHQNK